MAKRYVGVRVGDLTKTSAKAVVTSLTNTATTFTCNGVQTAVTWTAIGTDTGSVAGYYAHIAITGLTPFTVYTWTVVQGTWSNSGGFRTVANISDDFTLFFMSCNVVNRTTNRPGAYSYVRDYQLTGALPVQAILFHDDLCYVDNLTALADTEAGKTATGTPGVTLKEFDYALGWFAWYGLMSSHVVSLAGTPCTVLENSAFMPQWGDHEFIDDVRPASFATPNAYHATAGGYNGVGLSSWQKLLAPLQGTALTIKNLDTASNHWAADFGIVRYVATDGITRNNGSPGTVAMGDAQIDDILASLKVPTPMFKLLGMCNEPRNIASTGIYNKIPEILPITEYDRLFRDAGSIGDSLHTLGGAGCLAILKGDNHSGCWSYLQAPTGGGKAAEGVLICNANNAAGSLHVGTIDTAKIGTVEDNARIYWSSNQAGRNACIQIDVYGSRGVVNIKFIWDSNGSFGTNYNWTVPIERWFGVNNTNEGAVTEEALRPECRVTACVMAP